jgi:2-phosphosulfolactate phosphatase
MRATPRILRKSLLSGTREAEGVVVVIDVLRAFTSAALMLYLGADKIVLLAEPEAVLKLKREQGCLAVGEVRGEKVPGFDLGNSPSRVLAQGDGFFRGQTVAQRTSAGVAGAVAAGRRVEKLILGSYVTAHAIADHIQSEIPPPEVVSLVAMGNGGREVTPDDEGCADYIEHLLTGRPYDHVATLREIIQHECTKKFLRADRPHFPPADPLYCLQRDLFDFVILACQENGQLVARAERP